MSIGPLPAHRDATRSDRVTSRPLRFDAMAVWRDWGPDKAGAANERLVGLTVAEICPPVAPPLAPGDPASASVGFARVAPARPPTPGDLGEVLARLHAHRPPRAVLDALHASGGLSQAARAVARCIGEPLGGAVPPPGGASCSSRERDVLVRAYDRLVLDEAAGSFDPGAAQAHGQVHGLAHGLVHGDATVDNLIVTADGPLLIDWEEGGVGPSWADLAPSVARSLFYATPAGQVRDTFAAYQDAGGVLDASLDDPVWLWRARVYGLYATANACERRGRGGDPREPARRLAYWATGSLRSWTVQ